MESTHAQTDGERTPSGDAFTPLANAIRGDMSTFAEMLIAIIPVVAYCCIYFVRWRVFRWFGVSREFIAIKLEDLLFVGITVLVLYWSQLANWLVTKLRSRDRGRSLRAFIDVFLVLVLAVQAVAMALFAARSHIFDAYQFAMLGVQALLVLLWLLASGRRWVFAGRDGGSAVAIALVCAALFVALSVGRAAYLVFHTSQYQVCSEHNTLIVAYLEEGLAIEKDVVSMEEGGACVLSPGYHLSSIEDAELRVAHFSHIVAE